MKARCWWLGSICLVSCSTDMGSRDAGSGRDGGARDGMICGTTFYVPQDLKNKIDVLFMIDNSPGMEPEAQELRARLASFWDPFQRLAELGVPVDLHVGVVTS